MKVLLRQVYNIKRHYNRTNYFLSSILMAETMYKSGEILFGDTP